MTFSELSLIDPILEALKDEGYETPTPIQAQSIPHILLEKDILGSAQTGTGKTAAFSIPILQLLSGREVTTKPRPIRSLILTPTRELAIQIEECFQNYGKNLSLHSLVIFGGVSQNPQVDKIKRGTDILIATPGRLLDLIQQGFIRLDDIEIFVLDEADRMLDMGFIHDVKKVIKLLPAKRQSLFFSATMPDEIIALSQTILKSPVRVEVAPVSSTADMIDQYLYYVNKQNKNALLLEVIRANKIKRVLVFTRTKHGADKVVKMLQREEIKSAAIHGNKSQNARQNALNDFKNHKITVLVATDIAARGIDLDDLEHVINYEIPNESESYVHRIGRTGRAGANGIAYSFCDVEEKKYVKDIEKLIRKSIPVLENPNYPMIEETKVDSPYTAPKAKSTQNRNRNWQRRR